ncbi:MAG: ACP S-malonyltransferase [Chloroflexi bacterium]|nr:ACP S-malonyltransferase [Chloroflexota bacterium]
MAERQAYVFPGQGSQSVGMGRDLLEASPAARAVFQEADDALGFPLSRLCFEGPEGDLKQTVNAQPAIMAVSWACFKAASRQVGVPAPSLVAGHSLGEYTALVAAGVLDFGQGIRLVRERGRLMQEAGDSNPGGMAALLAVDLPTAEALCRDSGCQIANLNCPGQVVIAGGREALDKARALAQTRGIKRFMPLDVSGAFHTPLMAPAAAGMSLVLEGVAFREPQVPVVANSTGLPLTTGQAVKEELMAQLTHCVQWQSSVEHMAGNGVSTFVEVGPGRVLTGLIKRIVPGARLVNWGDWASVSSRAA